LAVGRAAGSGFVADLAVAQFVAHWRFRELRIEKKDIYKSII
jgi:hypothetical protein